MTPALHLERALPPPRRSHRARPLTLCVEPGEWCEVAAPPTLCGALARMAAGLLPAHAGRIRVLGADPSRLGRRELRALRARLGVVLRPDGLISNVSLRMNCVVPLVYGGIAGMDEALGRADAGLAAAGIDEWAADRPADVPPDVRAAAAVVRAAVRRPELLVMQDPFAALGPARTEALAALCRGAAATVVVATPQPGPLHAEAARRAEWEQEPHAEGAG